MITTAGAVATELRRVADALDKEPEAEVVRPLCFFYPEDKAGMENLVRLLPHPLDKFSDGKDEFSNIGIEMRGGPEPPGLHNSRRPTRQGNTNCSQACPGSPPHLGLAQRDGAARPRRQEQPLHFISTLVCVHLLHCHIFKGVSSF